ncbi:MAG: CGNR zinc finger domain-containing protein [Pseudonocardiaceae bacterium]
MERDGFRFRSGRLCLDFAATLARRYRDGVEQLVVPEDLQRWLRVAGLPGAGLRVDAAELACARALREAVYRLLHPAMRDTPEVADMDVVNRWAAFPDPAPRLAVDARTKITLADRPLEAGLSAVARDAVDLLCGDMLGRVRECARTHCSVLFLDSSRPGQRRWCDMAVCGNQAKARRHRQLHTVVAPRA